VGWKQYTTTKQGARFLVGLHDAKSGELTALIEANKLGQMRTGAVSGVAANLLADRHANSLGLLGTGWQAESQLAAVAAVRPLRTALVHSRDPDRRRAFAERMRQELGIDVRAVDHARLAVEYQPIVITATSSKTPVFDGRWLTRGTLVCAMGSNWLHKAEVDVATIEAANLVVCDSIAACQAEAGDLIKPLAEGVFHWRDAVELADIAAGKHPGRRSSEETIVFKSVGLGIEDVALAAKVVELARERSVGKDVSL
jgi:ornithine cyclodeaminase/alanine dehydrogenase-like protein (mu-crystallin family)